MKMGSSTALRSFILLTCVLNGNIILQGHGTMISSYMSMNICLYILPFKIKSGFTSSPVAFSSQIVQVTHNNQQTSQNQCSGHRKEKLFKGLQMLWKVGPKCQQVVMSESRV